MDERTHLRAGESDSTRGRGTPAILIRKAKNKILMLKVLKELTGKGNVIPSLGDDTNVLYHRRSTQFSDDSQRDHKDDDDDDTQSVGLGESTNLASKPAVPRTIILHYSPFKAVWDWITLLLVLYTAVYTPYMAAFSEDKPTSSSSSSAFQQRTTTTSAAAAAAGSNASSSSAASAAAPPGVESPGCFGRGLNFSVAFSPMNVIDMVVDIMFIADILINFRTTYIHNGEVVLNPKKIAYNYMKSWFVIDAIAAIPFDLLLCGAGTNDQFAMPVTGVLKTARLLRLLRVARRIDQYSEYGGGVLLLLMATFTLIAHWLACLFYAVTNIERTRADVPPGWLEMLADKYKTNITNTSPDIRTRYITTLYFTFTILTSVGFGNVAAYTNYEKIFTIFVMLVGSLMSAAIFGNVSSIMLRLYRGTEDYHEMLTSIKEFIKFHYIPKELGNRLLESYQHTRSFANGVDMNSVLKSFPDCLQADICLHLNHNLLNSCSVFKQASPGCLRALSMRFKSIHAPPGDTLIHPGDVLDSIYFIARGSIEIVDDEIVMAILGKDDIFGEDMKMSFFDPNRSASKSNYTVRAMSYSDMHRIRIDDLHPIMDSYPDFASDFLQKFGVTFNLKRGLLRANTELMDFIKVRRKKSYFPEESMYKDSCFQTVPQIKKSLRDFLSITKQHPDSADVSADDDKSSSIVELSPEFSNPVAALISTPAPPAREHYRSKLPRLPPPPPAVCPVSDDARSMAVMAVSAASVRRHSLVRSTRKTEHSAPPAALSSKSPVWTTFDEDDDVDDSAATTTKPSRHSAGGGGGGGGSGGGGGCLSPIASGSSSLTYPPKSSPSSGLPSGQSPFESEGVAIKYLSTIDDRLKTITQRMGNFEQELCITIDAILNMLGYEPELARCQIGNPLIDTTTTTTTNGESTTLSLASVQPPNIPNLLSVGGGGGGGGGGGDSDALLMMP